MTLLRRVLGETLRGQRLRQRRTLREVSGAARVSLGYLSEVERGQKEASSELLASICDALDVRLSEVLREASDTMRRTERAASVARAPARQLVPAGAAVPGSASGTPVQLPVAHPEPALDVELPAEFDSAELVDRIGLDATGGISVRDTIRDRLDPGRLNSDRLDPGRLEGDGEPERIGLDGVDLAELETGDGLGDVDTLLSLTDLSGCLDRPHGAHACLAGRAAAA
jgi:transcriptional regulator with XRE-family HTH domain